MFRSLTQERGNRAEEKKEKWESLQPLGRAAQGQGGGERVAELTAGWSPSPCSSEKKPTVATPEASEIRQAGLTSGCTPPPPRRCQAQEGLCLVLPCAALAILKFFLIFKPEALIFILQQQIM